MSSPTNPRYATVATRSVGDRLEQIDRALHEWVASRDAAAVIGALEGTDVAVGEVYDAAMMLDDPTFAEREAIVAVEDEQAGEPIRMPGVIPKLAAQPGKVRWGAPRLALTPTRSLAGSSGSATMRSPNCARPRRSASFAALARPELEAGPLESLGCALEHGGRVDAEPLHCLVEAGCWRKHERAVGHELLADQVREMHRAREVALVAVEHVVALDRPADRVGQTPVLGQHKADVGVVDIDQLSLDRAYVAEVGEGRSEVLMLELVREKRHADVVQQRGRH